MMEPPSVRDLRPDLYLHSLASGDFELALWRDKRVPSAFDRKRRRNRYRPLPVQVAPPGLPDRRPVLPAAVLAGQQQFQGFREARLAAAVAPDDQGQSGARF